MQLDELHFHPNIFVVPSVLINESYILINSFLWTDKLDFRIDKVDLDIDRSNLCSDKELIVLFHL